MKVLICTDCAAQGEHLEADKVYELDSDVAADLLRMGRAVQAPVMSPSKSPRKLKTDGAE